MRSFLLSMLACACLAGTAQAQDETDNWCFGMLAGVNFSSGTPVAIPLTMVATTEGTASMSDTAGNLLFYTDGVTVYDGLHQVMPNGNGLMGDPSSTQSALIVRKPGSYSLYYLFTVAADGSADGLRYSIIDMDLNGGMGDVTTTKNVLLMPYMTEKICAVNRQDDSTAWIVGHGWGSNEFYVYSLTAAGLSTTPQITPAGTVHDSAQIQNSYGYMKFSPNGQKLAVAIAYQDIVEIFDFSTLDGAVSNPVTLNFTEHTYGVEFSPSSKYLYLTRYNNTTQTFFLDQFNMQAGSPAAIAASGLLIAQNAFEEMRALQLAKDGKIYVAKSGTGFLDVINAPDMPGPLATYMTQAVSLDGNMCMLGLPNFNASFFRELAPPVAYFAASDSNICATNCILFTDSSSNNPSSWSWSFQGGIPATSTQQNPSVCFSAPGVYAVSLIATNSKGSDTVTMTGFITVIAAPAQATITVAGTTLTSSSGGSYQWYFNGTPITGATNQTHTATQTGNYHVVVVYNDGCSSTSSASNITVGIREVAKNEIAVYPNPSGDYCYISNSSIKEVAGMQIIDAVGRILPANFIQQQGTWRVALGGIAPGMYTIRVVDAQGMAYRGSIVVIR